MTKDTNAMEIEAPLTKNQSKMEIESPLTKNSSKMEIEAPLTKNRYEKVQFISWEVHTGPYIHGQGVGLYTGLGNPVDDKRTDAEGQCWDIEARVAFTKEALKLALKGSDPSSRTLKVFMAPEFLYRGAGGAYLHDLLDGWSTAPAEFGLPPIYSGAWGGLFGQLRNLVAHENYEHWIVVFGTAVSASFHTQNSPQGKRQLNVAEVAEVYNSALVQRGGSASDGRANSHVTRKHYMSGIDFFSWYGAAQHGNNVEHLDPTARRLVETSLGNASSLFQFDSVGDRHGTRLKFGIEICLDHAISAPNNNFGRIRAANEEVNIQLVPSAGMFLQRQSICLCPANAAAPNAYAFNCDGLSQQQHAGGFGSHTQIWSAAHGVAMPPSMEVIGGEPHPGSKLYLLPPRAATSYGEVAADRLWNNLRDNSGAGSVRIMDPCPI
ncbi:hypothetical protein [Massilia sp. YIM B04103]|uniref:hypothetical protein n=1 Tax=Massilia sp. YIM B04103 TaxID=2963106 RepID=UPI00210CB33A|nr:hypothetical protein [Massilia sp. YIM B04103]